ncbi:hypothetical protein IPJ72_06025 [Candidatus Peregrinibacteria bacterium]|nr:MAG: hypothetical protein IPJ72_06025 [Candidatus Peregrinibacteria bacterium]
MKESDKRDQLSITLKDKKGGRWKVETKIRVAVPKLGWVNSVSPLSLPALMNQETVFMVQGAHLPEGLLYYIPDCTSVQPKQVQVQSPSRSGTFSCTPRPMETTKNPSAWGPQDGPSFIKRVETQRREIILKYPKHLTDSKQNDPNSGVVIYRGSFLPMQPSEVESYHQIINSDSPSPKAKTLSINDHEAIIRYLIEHPGQYPETLLKQVGWREKRVNGVEAYENINCSPSLEKEGEKTAFVKNTVHLPLIGSCATGLSRMLIAPELETLY